MIDAAHRFDVARGIKFETFAERRVRGAMIDALRKDAWPRGVRRQRRELDAAREALRRELGHEPSMADLAARVGSDEKRLSRTIVRINTIEALLYWAAQLLGGVVAAFVLKTVIPDDTWRAVHLGTPELARDFPVWAGMSLEAVTTFFLVLVVFATAVDEKGAFKAISGFGIGLTITLGILVAGPLTGAALNPARAFGPALAATYWAHHGIYWIGPLAGGFLAGLLYDTVFLKKA